MALNLGDLVAYLKVDDSGFGQGLGKAEGKFSGWGGKIAGLAGGAALAAGAAFAAAFSEAMDMEQANDKLAAQMGATGQYAADLGKIAGDVYAGAYGDSLGQVNEALRGVMQSGAVMEDASDEQIQHVTEGVLNLASAFDVDLRGATTAVGQMMRTGMAKDANEALDIITRGMQEGGDASGDLLDTFTEYPALFQRLGLGGSEAMGLINQGMANGARNSDLVADALKEFQIRATDGSKTSAASFEALGLNAEKMTATFAKGGPQAAAAMDVVFDRLRKTKGQADASTIAFGLFGTQSEDLGNALYALDPSDAVADMGKVAGAADQMGATLSDNAATKVEQFKRGAMQALITYIADYVLPFFGRLRGAAQTIADAFSGTNSTVSSALGSVGATLASAGEALRVIWDAIGGDILGGWRGVWNAIKTTFGGVLNIIRGVLNVFAGLFTGDWSRIWEGVKGIAKGAWGIITGIFSWAWSAIRAIVSIGAKAIGGLLSGLWAAVKGAAGAAWDWIVSKLSGAWRSIRSGVSSGVSAVVSFMRGLPGRILSALGNVGSLLLGAGRSLLEGLWNGISGAAGWLWGKIQGWASGVLSNIKGFFGIGSPSKVFAEYGGYLMQGMAQGIAAEAGTATKAALRASGQVSKALQSGGRAAAARELLNAIRSGKQVFEDYSFRGMSKNLDRYNEALVKMAPVSSSDPRATAGWLEQGLSRGAFGAPKPNVRVYIGNRELTDIVRVEADRSTAGAFNNYTQRMAY